MSNDRISEYEDGFAADSANQQPVVGVTTSAFLPKGAKVWYYYVH